MKDELKEKAQDPNDPQAVCKYVDSLIEESSSYRKKYEKDWVEFSKFYDGQHWKGADKKPKVNWVFTIIEYEVPILTDARPGTDVISNEDERADDAKVLKEAIDYVYYCNHVDLRLAQAIRSALISTNSYLYVDWDPEKDNGEGQVVIKNLPWRYVYLDPSEGDIDDMNYVIIKHPVKIDTIKRLFPLHAEEIEAEEISDVDAEDENDIFMVESRYHAPRTGNRTSGMYKPEDMAYLVEAWVRDYELTPIPDEETQEVLAAHEQALMQGMVPEVTRYQNHPVIIEALQLKLQELGFVQQEEQAEAQEIVQTGPQIIQEEIMAKVQDGSIPDEQSALMAEDALMTQLEEHVTQPSENDLTIALIQDLIAQHEIAMKQNPDGMKPKYPGNLRLIVKSKDVVLYDGPTPVESGMVPLSPVYAYKLEGRPYSDGEVKNVIDSQKAYNELFWDEHQNLRLNANSGWVLDDNSGVDETTLTNDPGIVLRKKAGTEVRRLEPGQVSPQLAMKQTEHRSNIQDISGITEVAQGKRPTGISAAAAISALQEQSIGRIRLKSRMLEEYTMLRLGQIVAGFIVKYWDKPRMLKVYDDDSRIQSLVFDPQRIYDLKYQVRMTPGTTFGISKEAIFNQTKEMLQGGAIDAQMFFEINRNNIPYAAKILQRLKERDELVNQATMLADENAVLKSQLEQLLGPEAMQAVNGAGAPPVMQPPVAQVS